jgi:hypothetical protein
MILLFKPRDKQYIGKGSLPFGSFDDTSKWQPITKFLEKGAVSFPDKTMFRVADREGNLTESYKDLVVHPVRAIERNALRLHKSASPTT